MNTRILALLLEVKINKKEIFLLLLDIKMNTREIPFLLLDVKMNGCRSIRPYYHFGHRIKVDSAMEYSIRYLTSSKLKI
jgi:hypothetical protein